ncbi:hypothetical protein JCM33774_32300 [Actinophytocola sp. KF-1]
MLHQGRPPWRCLRSESVTGDTVRSGAPRLTLHGVSPYHLLRRSEPDTPPPPHDIHPTDTESPPVHGIRTKPTPLAKGREPTTKGLLPAIPSTWRSPITLCQGGPKHDAPTRPKPPGPLDAV